jgi:hypothetical protein
LGLLIFGNFTGVAINPPAAGHQAGCHNMQASINTARRRKGLRVELPELVVLAEQE